MHETAKRARQVRAAVKRSGKREEGHKALFTLKKLSQRDYGVDVVVGGAGVWPGTVRIESVPVW